MRAAVGCDFREGNALVIGAMTMRFFRVRSPRVVLSKSEMLIVVAP